METKTHKSSVFIFCRLKASDERGKSKLKFVLLISKKDTKSPSSFYETHPLHPVVWSGRVLQVQQDPVEGPCESYVHSGVMGGVTLQSHVLSLIDVCIGGGQCDLCGICI